MKPDRDSLDEFYEYEAEDFLVYLALLITEGRTPEHSVKGRTEGPHCPPAQSSQPAPNKHECSDKLAQCLEARKTRSEVAFLWRNNIPIMVEVMLLPDCCYSEEGANTEGNDLNDPALKQDALLLERWTLEPVPRQSGDRFIEEKTLLLAIRSFVFFSQLSAWLSVSHGAVPCNILYRVSAAGEELKLNFSHSPTEHMFPVPNVSYNVALKVSVQSLPRQSSYPVLNCSIHSNLGFYEKKIIPREHSLTLPRSSQDNDQNSAPVSPHTFTKQAWSVGPEGLLHARTNVTTDLTLPVRNSKLLSTVDNRYNIGTTPSKLQCFSLTGNYKAAPQEPSVRNFKSFSLVGVPCSPQDSQTVETNTLIGTLIQERQEIIARIAQHLLQCDQTSSQINGHSVVHELSSINSKIFKNSSEDEQFQKKNKDIPPICTSTLNLTLPTDNQKINPKKAPDTPINSSRPIPEFHTSPKPQARRKLILFESNEYDCNTFQSSGQSAISLSSSENIHKVIEKRDIKQSEISARTGNQISNSSNTNDRLCTNTQLVPEDKNCTDSSHKQKDNSKLCSTKAGYGNGQAQETTCRESRKSDHSSQLLSIENCINKDRDNIQYKEPQDKAKSAHDENEDPTNCDCWKQGQRKCNGNCLRRCERLKKTEQKTVQLRHSSTWKKQTFRSLDGISTKAFHPRTGLPLLSSPVPQRKTQSGYFDLDTSLLKLKGLSTQRQHSNGFTDEETEAKNKQLSSSAPPAPCLSLLGNFEESVLNYRFEPLGVVDGFTAEVGASGIFCPTHMTLPVKVSFYSVSDDNAPSPYMGNIALESLGKRGYRIPPSGTIQVTLFNPNKTVVKMFVVKYDLRDMPANHQTFLRQRTFSVPVRRDTKGAVSENGLKTEDKTLRYLIHLRFQSSKSGKIYLHRDVRLLFSRKSMEVDSGAAYELKSYIESPINPPYSPRC
ncbi:protein FAM214A isoform X1 [Xenopus laevis]|uniref:Atos homolog protein A n=1 Tax=Xenopus laevis TaxID=8355 RepID=A0A8J0UK20_XENLA|nr:protein FAM214A isoform X1 [Xenopus laevis]